MSDNSLESVNFEYVKSKLGDGTVRNAKALLIDSRPAKRFEQSHIPASINIPDSQIDKYIGQIANKPKDYEIITYCQGSTCEKSVFLAVDLKKRGYTNIKVYNGGLPEWETKSFVDIGNSEARKYILENKALFIDARPFPKYKDETIQSAINIPDNKFNDFIGRLPRSLDEKIVVFCGGVECEKSFDVATKLYAMGYKKAMIYSEGLPGYKKAGFETTASCKILDKTPPSASLNKMAGPIKLGAEEGTVDVEGFKKLIENKPANVHIFDLRSPETFTRGHILGAVNMRDKANTPEQMVAKFPKDGYIVLICATGTKALEAYLAIKDDLKYKDIGRVFYLDAKVVGSDGKVEITGY